MINDINDTIAAISTPIGKGAIAIVRLSGQKAIEIVDSIFKGKESLKNAEPNKIYYGEIVDENKMPIDQVLVSIFKAPKSFTGEDIVEINCHGGVVIPNAILRLLLKNGARLAYNGEFTKRAFLNGKIDIIQAEAINDIINSTTLLGTSIAIKNLNRSFSEKIEKIRKRLLNLFSKVEVVINYPEEEIEIEKNDKEVLIEIINDIKNILKKNRLNKKIFEGFRVVIAGRTNVGKSSLLNHLSGEEKAIVSHIHGTTRDIIEVEINIKNIPIVLIDTAGIREEYDNEIEGYGIIKAKENIKKADLVLFVFEADKGITEEDNKILKKINNKNIILVGNKSDIRINNKVENAIYISAKNGSNIETLIEKIKEELSIRNIEETDFYINSRHKDLLEKALNKLETAKEHMINEDIDLLSIELQDSINLIDNITGKNLQEDLFDNIFSKFCVGK
ncbi:MAG TPA: tRNA uridine-5-carboxymethylaminomethyl(34) synthesis GTPase MnmE [Spirochaetota bacterium]|nr:tRNA uridine-5-carboxymethylaminomethyl(34) synthesis GTPase MnmE [Spirochaetota bacterium]HOM38408.1 tRNA uridine-5-carboxymethylaminomethyl(34) synthesis GTPase MnmE [Spirochaetota bacterium]HPQ48947.1 tRNA uridine-5-carboxymethylaminomethyl(34) synthesis GTPase MnmE [Spirochaetota bacterium]